MVKQPSFHNQTVHLGLIAATIYRYKSDIPLPAWLEELDTSR